MSENMVESIATAAPPEQEPSADMLPESIASALIDEWERLEGESMREGHRATMERLIAQVIRDRVGCEASATAAPQPEGEPTR